MKTYQPAVPRTAIVAVAIALTVITLAIGVAAPATVHDNEYVPAAVVQAGATDLPTLRIDVVGTRDSQS